MVDSISFRKKADAFIRVITHRPKFAAILIFLSVAAAVFEGIGLSFILPIIELAQQSDPAEASGLLELFVLMYDIAGIPFELPYLIAGVAIAITIRYSLSFLVSWFRDTMKVEYIRYLQTQGFENALHARVSYFDAEGSDDILNAIVTQSERASEVISQSVRLIEQLCLSFMYGFIALYIAPFLTILTVIFLGGATLLFRNVLEGGYSIGDEVADANEGIQSAAQAGTQGIRDVKLFGRHKELLQQFNSSVEKYEVNKIKLLRNKALIHNSYQLLNAIAIFMLIYFALQFSSMTVGELGVFLFAMFRLGPRASNLNKMVYNIEGNLPHLIRTHDFIEDLKRNREPSHAEQSVPATIDEFSFDSVDFTYQSADERALDDVSFSVRRGEFAGFVGPSGAGKSTIMSLAARMYDPDEGDIRANGDSVSSFDIDEWRDKISVIRQKPYIFNDTLEQNITIADREVSRSKMERVCEIAQVTEFLDDLPNGYDTELGDEGVKLSGGQRQRVAIARSLLKEADLLILDEATSDLDTTLEKKVHRAIEERERNCTMLVIAHRLSTVVNADCIYVMEDGEIVERGKHRELLGNNGIYTDLYESQSEPNEIPYDE